VAADFYGTDNAGAIYGAMIVAWSLGGVIGPLGISAVREATGGFDLALYLFAGLAVVATAITFATRQPDPEQAEQHQQA
jgi:MFS transporter, OFA family, oxalate/formate antiporter